MTATREQLVDTELLGLDYPLPALHYLTGKAMRLIRSVVSELGIVWSPFNYRQGQFPFIVPIETAHAFRPALRGDVCLVPCHDGQTRKLRGYLPVAGGCFQAIPFVSNQLRSYRQLPMGLYCVDFSVSPFTRSHSTGGWEDVVCVNGLDIRASGRPQRTHELIAAFLKRYRLDACQQSEPWLFQSPAVTYRTTQGVLLAVIQEVPHLESAHWPFSYSSEDNRSQQADADLLYLSEDALLMAALVVDSETRTRT